MKQRSDRVKKLSDDARRFRRGAPMQAARRAEAAAERGLQGERVHNARSHTEWIAENKTEQL
jgi:hypothetical protein